MATVINNVRRNSNVDISATIEGIETSISYNYGNFAPVQINVNSYYRSDGFSANINRIYSSDGSFTPELNPIYSGIFTPQFESELNTLITRLFAEYDTFTGLE